jgi:AcrR family transcriptional regulator
VATENGDTTQGRLLAAGRSALLSGGIELLANGLTVEQVVARAGVSAQTFHNVFPRHEGRAGGKAQFLEELLISLVGSALPNSTPEQPRRRGLHTSGDPVQIVRDLCRWVSKHLEDDSATHIRAIAWTVGARHPGTTATIAADYTRTTGIVVDTYISVLREWGAGLRQPFTTESLAVVITALAEGLVLRSRFDPEAVPDTLLGDAVIALVSAVVDVNEERGHIDDVMVDLSQNALRDRRPAHSDDLPDDPESAILSAAATEFALRGYFDTRQVHIADRAGVDLPTLRRLFPTNVDVVVAGLKPVLDALQRRIATDIRLDRPPVDILRRYSFRLAELVIAHRSFVDAMVLLIGLHTAQSPVDTTRIREELFFPGLITDVIESGQQSGALTADLPAVEIAAALTNNVMFRSISRREETADQIAHTVNLLILGGVVNN